MIRPRVVFDCNVLLQAIANGDGPAGPALRLLETNKISVYLSRAVLKELHAVLRYPKVRTLLGEIPDERVNAFLKVLMFQGVLVGSVRHVFDYPRARQDEPYIDLAFAVKANYLVSRDKDLLSLGTAHSLVAKQFRQKLPALKVVDPVEFVKVA